MARLPNKAPPRLSLFDRLLQGDSMETDRNVDRALQELHESVRRDLEILFNTRPGRLPADPKLTELRQSILTFGLPEVQSQHLASPAQQEQFRKNLEDVIRRFEPRFRELSVTLIVPENQVERILRFQINAILETDSTTEAVIFNTAIDPVTGMLSINGR
ncbi:MAG: type VI secretion system baseplate subunit TssE [Shinella sp.]|uniref:type VI secretion system baseplate subunit TssE n=1 Tax=Shinella sp. TaxID=1870904 RepID=UPI0040355856